MAEKISKSDVDAKLDELKELFPQAAFWQILRNGDNAYRLYDSDGSGNLRKLADLGESAPDAIRTLEGVKLGVGLKVDVSDVPAYN
jgi:hypothetical protein